MVALSVSAFVSRVNFRLRQLNRKGGKRKQHDFPTQLCSVGEAGCCVCAASSVHMCLQQPECFSSEAIHQPRSSVSMGEGQTSQSLSLCRGLQTKAQHHLC